MLITSKLRSRMKRSNMFRLFGFLTGLFTFLPMVFYSLSMNTVFLLTVNVQRPDIDLSDKDFQYSIGSDELSALVAHFLPKDKQFYYNYTSYDIYSVHDIGQSKPRLYWEKFSLAPLKHYPQARSPSGLAFVESIMVITGKHLTDRHEHIEKVFLRQGIRKSSIEYRWKWTKKNCMDLDNYQFIKSMFPYNNGSHLKDPGCAVVIEHINAWYAIAERNLSFALIVEDDVVFVPFLKEKFNRFMAEAAKRNLIKVGKNQNDCVNFENNEKLTMEKLLTDPILTEGIFHFGSCLNIQTPGLNASTFVDVPRFTSYRHYYCGRCAHMYGMTHCAAKMMIEALHKVPTRYQWADWLINHIITNSPKLIGWWTDPPLAYQTSQIEIIGNIDLPLKQRTYDPDLKAGAP